MDLTRLRHELPYGWTCFDGIGGILYAEYRRVQPPIRVRACSAEELKLKVRVAQIDLAH